MIITVTMRDPAALSRKRRYIHETCAGRLDGVARGGRNHRLDRRLGATTQHVSARRRRQMVHSDSNERQRKQTARNEAIHNRSVEYCNSIFDLMKLRLNSGRRRQATRVRLRVPSPVNSATTSVLSLIFVCIHV